MVDKNNNYFTNKEDIEKSKKNKLFLEIKERAKKIGISFQYMYVVDDYVVAIFNSAKSPINMWIDGRKGNKLKIRCLPKSKGFTNEWEVKDFNKTVNALVEAQEFINWLAKLSIAKLDKYSEKENANFPDGSFDTSTENKILNEIKKEIIKYYNLPKEKEYLVSGNGIKNGDNVYFLTENIPHHMRKFAPVKYDLHIFEKGKYIKTIKNVLKSHKLHSVGTYSDFFIDNVLMPEGTDGICRFEIRYETTDYEIKQFANFTENGDLIIISDYGYPKM